MLIINYLQILLKNCRYVFDAWYYGQQKIKNS